MWLVQWKNTDCASMPNMSVTISAETFSQFFTSPLGAAVLIGVIACLVVLAVSAFKPSRLLRDLGAVSTALLIMVMILGALNHTIRQESEAVDSTLAAISDQYEISDLTRDRGEHIEPCTPGSPADKASYSWLSEDPEALHEGILVKTAEVDGSCSYTLYSQSQVTPIAGG